MANLNHKDIGFHIDSSTGVLTDIKAYINNQELARTIALQETEGEGQEERTWLPGLGSGTFTINGFVNTTTDGIFGPLIADNTSITKTVAYRESSSRFYKGEVYATNVRYSGDRESLQTFSADLTVSGAFTRTSVAGT